MLARVGVENRPEGSVELRVHRDEVLAVLERLERNLCSELDRSGDVHDRVDLLRSAEEERVLGDDGASRPHRVFEVVEVRRFDGVVVAGVAEHVERLLGTSAVDRDDLHSRDAVSDLVREALSHEAGAQHPDPDGPAFLLAGAQRPVDDDHQTAPAGSRSASTAILRRTSDSTSASSGQAASFSEISLTGRGHVSPRAGSSHRSPPSAPGV